jgi:hypothetical protein
MLMGMGGKQSPYICFENNGRLGTMEIMLIVLDNRLKEQCSALIWGMMVINSRQ